MKTLGSRSGMIPDLYLDLGMPEITAVPLKK